MNTMIMLILAATTAVAVAQAPPKQPKPAADPFGGGQSRQAGGARQAQPTVDPFAGGGRQAQPASGGRQVQPSADPFGGGGGGQVVNPPTQVAPRVDDPFDEDPFGPPRPRVMIRNIDVVETELQDLLEFVREQLRDQGEAAPNFVYREGAEKQVISSLRLRNVSLDGLLQVLESVLDMNINTVDNPGGEDIIVLRSPDVLPVSGAVRGASFQRGSRVSLAPVPVNPAAAAGYGLKDPELAPVTRIFATSDLGVEEEDLMSAIRAVWDTSDPEWAAGEGAAKMLFHPGTRMLVLKASPDRLEDVEQIMGQLSRVKDRAQQGEVVEMRRRLQDIERSTDRNLRQMEEAHQRTVDEMKDDRSRLMEKISQLELELRKAQMQRVRIPNTEKAGEGGH